ncbi:MAG: ATP-grasp domain-containing protein [Planctomycetota bacterium]
MRVVVLHNDPSEDACVAPEDVLRQRDAVAEALTCLGHDATCVGCTLDLGRLRTDLEPLQPDVVFNLVESLGGTDRLMSLTTLLLDALEIPYTGAPTEALWKTSNKLRAKAQLRSTELPTPVSWTSGEPRGARASAADGNPRRWIIKATWEHASFAMDDTAVVTARDLEELAALVEERERRIGRPHFAEEYIEGREFNLSLLASTESVTGHKMVPQVLPAAEIEFRGYPPGKPRIVGQRAKWDADSFEYRETPRRFDFEPMDENLIEELSDLAVRCWGQFDLRGYARVDFRVDPAGRPWILEVNANPCLSPDAGFAAAVAHAGLDYPSAIARILADVRR